MNSVDDLIARLERIRDTNPNGGRFRVFATDGQGDERAIDAHQSVRVNSERGEVVILP